MSDTVAFMKLAKEFTLLAEQYGVEPQVLFTGPIDAETALISEYPGEQEVKDEMRRPFVGKSGKLMWEAAKRFGIERGNVWASNAVKRQVGRDEEIHKDELAKWKELLLWELAQLPNLKTVFVMGGTPLSMLLGRTGVLSWRGSVVESSEPQLQGIKFVISFNPAYVLPNAEPKMEAFFVQDLGKLHSVISKRFKPHKVEALINPTYKEALAYIRRMIKEKKPTGTDIEHRRETYCYGIGNSPHEAMCINFRDLRRNRFSESEEANLYLGLQELFDSNKMIVQNGGHEKYWSWYKDGLRMRTWWDTMLSHHLLLPQVPHSLAFQVAQYTNHEFYKEDGEGWMETGDIDTYWQYNCKDVALMIASQQAQFVQLEKLGLLDFFFNHVMRAQQHTALATVHGVAIDHKLSEYLASALEQDVQAHLNEMHRLVWEATGDPEYCPNPGSPKQMAELYFDALQLKGKGRSTNKANRDQMLKDPGIGPLSKEIIAKHNLYASESKFAGTFVNAVRFKLGDDKRMRCDWKQTGVVRAPGRLSSASTIDEQGMNMQNQPMRARAMYVTDPGTVFAYFDLKQAEAVVVAYRANIPSWKADFERMRKDPEFDTHRSLAAAMFGIPYAEVPKSDWLDKDGKSEKDPNCDHNTLQPTKRYIGKRCRHGLNYRMMMFKLAEVTKLPFHLAVEAYFKYHKITPELEKWWKQEEKVFRAEHALVNAFGRPLKILQRLPAPGAKTDDEVMDSIVAFYPQSTVGDKVVRVWYQSEEDDAWPSDARICLDVHDNLVALASKKTLKTALKIMKRYAEEPIMISSCYGGEPEPVYLQAETKTSYPTSFKVKDGKLIFEKDPKGLHRWSHMEDIRV